ncbi:hypothetical protein Tco_0660650 [Tanacetum coccineum]
MLNNNSLPLPENEAFSLDHFDNPSLPRPPPEPPDDEICFNFEHDAGDFINKVVGDISEHDVLMPNLLPTQPTLCPVFDLLLLFSFENEDKLFKPGIFSSPFLSHWAKITFDFWRGHSSLGCLVSPFLSSLTKLKCGGSSQAQDSINKNKRFVGGNPYLS